MYKKTWTVLLALVGVTGLFSFFAGGIPKAWDMAQVKSMHLPFADSTATLEFVSEEEYYKLPVRTVFKTFPFYMPGTEPPGYYDSLRNLDPVILFKEENIRTEAEWTRAGELIYDMPMNYTIIDSNMLKLLPAMAAQWRAAGIFPDKKGIIPFVSISVREKGKIEFGSESCGMCHSKQMPDGRLLKGAQGNFMSDAFRNIMVTANPNFKNSPPENKLRQFHNFNKRLNYTPWVNNEYQDFYKKLKAEDMDSSIFRHILPGVQSRNGAAYDHPISIPDLFNLKERKYLDKTGHNLNRGIEDIMRYAILNQNLSLGSSYNGFIPDADPASTNPTDYRRVGRFSDTQLYALAKFLYTLKPKPNPEKFPAKLLEKGKMIFIEQGCVSCHTPPLYTNNMLTPVDGFDPPASHLEKYQIFNISVGTDPGLSLYTRRGSGYYKIPSLIGSWNRTAFLHDGHLKNLEDLFDSTRLSPEYEPTYYKPRGVKKMAVPGHPFGMKLTEEEKKALVAFVKSL
jgi:hypothetical protein